MFSRKTSNNAHMTNQPYAIRNNMTIAIKPKPKPSATESSTPFTQESKYSQIFLNNR